MTVEKHPFCPKPPGVFVRDATGLVREASGTSSLLAQWMLVTGGFPIFILTYLSVFPGGNFTLALILGFIPMLALQGVYSLFGTAMPRAGGDYVYVSRGLNPFIGFVSAFALAARYIISNGIFTVFGVGYLGYQLVTMGIFGKNQALLALGSMIVSPIYSFTFALLVTALAVVLAIVKPQYAWRAILWTGLIAIVCTVIMFGAMATINQTTFQTSYDAFISTDNSTLTSMGFSNLTTYQQTISAGGWTTPSNAVSATLAAFPVAIFAYFFSQLPSSWAGEIKRVQRSLPLVMVGGLVWLMIYFVLLFQLSLGAFGQPFLTSWSALSFNSSYPLQYALSDYIPFFTYLVIPNQFVMWAMFLALFIPVVFEVPALIIGAVRYLFAWSFDRVLPAALSNVNERTHTPILATLIVFVVSVLGSLLQAFDPTAVPSVLVPMASFGLIFVAIAAIVFPFAKKEMYEASFATKRKIVGLPVIVWLGIISLIGLVVGTYGTFVNPILLGTPHLSDYLFYGLAYGLGAVIFVVAYAYRKRSGVELALSFKEIPPE